MGSTSTGTKPIVIAAKDGTCGDGCGQETNKGRRFKQGHDARLRSILVKAFHTGTPVAVNGTTHSAEALLKEHGFPIPSAKVAKAPKPATKPKATTKPKASKKSAARKAGSKPAAKASA